MSGKAVTFLGENRSASLNVKSTGQGAADWTRSQFSTTAGQRPNSTQWATSEEQNKARASTVNRPPRSQTMQNAAKAAEIHYYQQNPQKLPLPTAAYKRGGKSRRNKARKLRKVRKSRKVRRS